MTAPLYLIPAPLGDGDLEKVIPAYNFEIINSIDNYVVEEFRTARRILRKMNINKPVNSLNFFLLNEHSKNVDLSEYLKLCLEGFPLGLLSEAGLPCIADPGSVLVKMAHKLGIPVVPLVGPSSIFMALMSSGFNGQYFTFKGYLPVDQYKREKELLLLERLINSTGQSIIFIETPYRNNHLLESLTNVCSPQLSLSVSVDLTLPTQQIITKTVKEWKKIDIDLRKRAAIFIIGKST